MVGKPEIDIVSNRDSAKGKGRETQSIITVGDEISLLTTSSHPTHL
jgi:hypothetical protein